MAEAVETELFSGLAAGGPQRLKSRNMAPDRGVDRTSLSDDPPRTARVWAPLTAMVVDHRACAAAQEGGIASWFVVVGAIAHRILLIGWHSTISVERISHLRLPARATRHAARRDAAIGR
jgi:hypothetical protein